MHPGLSRRGLAGAGLAASVLSLASAPPAVAAPTPSVAAPQITLVASRARVTAGEPVILRGRVSRAERGGVVRILNARGRVQAAARTKASGRYSVRLRPRYSISLRARWQSRVSRSVIVRVRARIHAGLYRLRLFGVAAIKGAVSPAPSSGGRVWVRVRRNGEMLLRRRVAVQDGGRFRLRFGVRRPGAYRATAAYDDVRHVPNRARTRWRKPPLPRIGRRARGPLVKLLERRLRRLRYHLMGVNRDYDYRTSDAVKAFHKVQGLPRASVVSEDTWRALATPRRPRPKSRRPRRHIEIDQSKQLLYTVKGGRISKILHTSTGRNGATRDGVFRVHRKLAGYSPGRLYYPSYFDGLRAIHGWPDVPPNAASHGCARVAMWVAKWIYRRAPVGTQVRIYH